MPEEQIQRFNRAKGKAEEQDKQQSKDYLSAYLNRVKEEINELGITIEDLEEVILDEVEPNKTIKRRKERSN